MSTSTMRMALLLLLLICSKNVSVAQTLMWAKNMGGSMADHGRATAFDASGNMYTTGNFRGTGDFDPGTGVANLTSAGDNDAFVSKLDPSGNFLWAKGFGGTSIDIGSAIAVDAQNNVYSVGAFRDLVDFNPGAGVDQRTAAGNSDIYIHKLDAAGNYVWVKTIGDVGADGANTVLVDANGDILIAGRFTGTVDFDPNVGVHNLTATGGGFVMKLSSSGNLIWAKPTGGLVNSVKADANGNIYITGNFTGTANFHTGGGTSNLTSNGSNDVFVSKLDALGNFLWAVNMGGTGSDQGNGLAVDAAGNVYTVGVFTGTADFNPGAGVENLVSAGGSDMFISKLNTSGDFVWAKRVGGASADEAFTVNLDGSGNVYIGGRFQNIVDFDPGPGIANITATNLIWMLYDGFILKLNSNGEYVWAISMGSDDAAEYVYSLNIDANDYIYATGVFGATANFAPAPGVSMLTSNGSDDIFVMKLAQPSCNTYATLTMTACDTFSLNGTSYTSSGTYTQTIPNAANCDSIITLILTINQTAYHTLDFTFCDSFTINGLSITSSGTYTQLFSSSTGCDSILTINASINQSSLDTLNVVHCGTYTFNGQDFPGSGYYPQVFVAANGCDSTVVLDLTINPGYLDTLTVSACNSYSFNDTTYTENGIFEHTFSTGLGCDSIVVLNLTISTSYNDTIAETACGRFSYNGQDYSASGYYQHSFTTGMGCDSIVTLHLTIHTVNTQLNVDDMQITAAEQGAAYQWIDCETNTPVPGANSATYTAESEGRYAVIISKNGCVDTSDCAEVGYASVYQLEMAAQLQIYPNPVAARLTISFASGFKNGTLRLINMLGQTVYQSQPLRGETTTIPTDKLSAGVYFVELHAADVRLTRKIMKQ
jgi:hypothetical protein